MTMASEPSQGTSWMFLPVLASVLQAVPAAATSTLIKPVPAPLAVPKSERYPSSTSLSIVPAGETDSRAALEPFSTSQEFTDAASEHSTLSARLDLLEGMQAGWDGAGSRGPLGDAAGEARALINKFDIDAPGAGLPIVGMDPDGLFVLHWSNAVASGTITTFGDGIYAYYFRSSRGVVLEGERKVGAPLPKEITTMFTQ